MSLEYGRIEAGHTIRSTVRGVAPFAVVTAVDAAPTMHRSTRPDHLALTHVPGKGWCAAAFHLKVADIQIVFLASTESSGRSGPAPAPDRLWGCDDLLTDARVACLITHGTGRREVLLVHGRRIVAPGHETLIELPAPAQLVRTRLARTMQVTGGIL